MSLTDTGPELVGVGPPRLGAAELEAIRAQRGRSTLLFITDRCPVGCAHCSVDARADSPMIRDFALFEQIVDGVCANPDFEVVGISGGEPFVEKRGLTLASERIVAAGKDLVVYTSGVWATTATPPRWVAAVLSRCATVYLSTDAHHAAALSDERYIDAARAIAAAGAWIVVQVIDVDDGVACAEGLLRRAFGPGWTDHAELRPTPALTAGRGSTVFIRTATQRGRHFGACSVVASPIVRYDGVVTACCNETVVMGGGPVHLRRRAGSGGEVASTLADFHDDPMLRAISSAGLGALTAHPRFADLADRRFSSICDLCWAMVERVQHDDRPDPILAALAATESS